jgi:hypothetical protein
MKILPYPIKKLKINLISLLFLGVGIIFSSCASAVVFSVGIPTDNNPYYNCNYNYSYCYYPNNYNYPYYPSNYYYNPWYGVPFYGGSSWGGGGGHEENEEHEHGGGGMQGGMHEGGGGGGHHH